MMGMGLCRVWPLVTVLDGMRLIMCTYLCFIDAPFITKTSKAKVKREYIHLTVFF